MMRRADPPEFSGTCPVPLSQYDRVVLGHGSGGRLTSELVTGLFLPAFRNAALDALEDQASVPLSGAHGQQGPRVALTTDGFVVRPLFFPGGDIGRLAVYGTVNDLAVGGARPVALAAAFILEEGFPLDSLRRVVESMRDACATAGVSIVTGDTKVVERGKGDSIFITTTGLGVFPDGCTLSVAGARPGDRVLVSGTLGDHGLAILSVREGLSFETTLESDCAPLTDLVRSMMGLVPAAAIRCMRDPTRGGLASVVNEIAVASNVGVKLVASAIPHRPDVLAACEMLGLDPLYAASEGRLVAVVAEPDAPRVLAAMRQHPLGQDAADIGAITGEHPRTVTIRSGLGGERVLAMLAGEELPRIC
jgi:hydrogenase expression/formation protein HypE